MAIDRPDWGPGGDRALVSTAVPGTTTGGSNGLVPVVDNSAYPVPSGATSFDQQAEDREAEAAVNVYEMILDEEPEAENLLEAIDDLPADVRRVVQRVAAEYPHLRGELLQRLRHGLRHRVESGDYDFSHWRVL